MDHLDKFKDIYESNNISFEDLIQICIESKINKF